MKTLKLRSSEGMSSKEYINYKEWLDKYARYTYTSYEFSLLLGMFILGQPVPLSPKEAGFE